MTRIRILVGLALGICAFTALTATASAVFSSTTTTGKAKGGQGVLTLEAGKEFPNIKCAVASGEWTIQKAEASQEPVTEGGHLQFKGNLEGKPKSKTTKGNCDANVSSTVTLQAEVMKPIEIQIQQLTKNVNTNLLGKLDRDAKIVIVGVACELFIPSKSNNQLPKTTIANSGSNIKLIPELTGNITTEPKGAGCGASGIKNSTTGSLGLEAGNELLAEGVKAI